MILEFAPVADLRCRIGESPVYDERSGLLYFVDILGRAVYAFDTRSRDLVSWSFETEVCSLGLAGSGGLVVALRDEQLCQPAEVAERVELEPVAGEAPVEDAVRVVDVRAGRREGPA